MAQENGGAKGGFGCRIGNGLVDVAAGSDSSIVKTEEVKADIKKV